MMGARMRTMLNIRCCWLSLIVAVCWAFPGSAQETEQVGQSEERGGWIKSGRTVSLPPGLVKGGRMPEGDLTRFSPALQLRSLFFTDDTLWIGTEGGLLAYVPEADTTLEIEGPLCGAIASITLDDDGALWVGGSDGISVRSDGLWLHYGARQHRIFSRVTELVQGEGRVWVGTYGSGCGYVTADSIRSFSTVDSLLDDRVTAIVEEGPNVIWFGTASGLCMSDTLHWESMRYGHRIPIGSIADCIFNEAKDLFLAVTRQGVVWYSLGRVRVFGPRDGLPGREINAFSLDPTGRVWAAGKGGVSVYDGSGWIPLRLSGRPLTGYRFLSACHDLEGRCYLGTDSGILLVHSRESEREIRIPQRFPDQQVTEIHRFGEDIWFLTGRRIYVMRHGLQEIAPPGEWLRGEMADFVVDNLGGIWVATRFGVLHHAGGEWEIFDRRQGLPTEHFVAAALSNDGDLWFGTFNAGVLRLSKEGWIHYTEAAGLPDDRIDDILVDGGGTPWVITGEGEIARFRENSWEHVALPRWEETDPDTTGGARDSTSTLDPAIRFLTAGGERRFDGVPFPQLRMGLDGAGRCIAAMRGGIYQFAGSGWRMISAPDWERGIEPTAVTVASNGSVWLGTARNGVYVRERGGWLHIGTLQGLTDNHILSIAEDVNGNIWIGTKYGGLNRFKPETTF